MKRLIKLFSHRHIQWVCSAIIILVAVYTKVDVVNYWHTNNITHVYPWYMPWLYLLWGGALIVRLWDEKSRLYSVWVMAIALIWFAIESFSVAG